MWYKSISNDWTLFLDRDGVINARNYDGYITSIGSFSFLPGVKEAIAICSYLFARIIVVTNQQCVGKGIISINELNDIHAFMVSEIEKCNGKIDCVFSATSLKIDDKGDRKPNPYMANLAKSKFPEIDYEKSIMIGDTDSDILFGKNLGMKTVLVKSDEITRIKPDDYVNSILEFAKKIKM